MSHTPPIELETHVLELCKCHLSCSRCRKHLKKMISSNPGIEDCKIIKEKNLVEVSGIKIDGNKLVEQLKQEEFEAEMWSGESNEKGDTRKKHHNKDNSKKQRHSSASNYEDYNSDMKPKQCKSTENRCPEHQTHDQCQGSNTCCHDHECGNNNNNNNKNVVGGFNSVTQQPNMSRYGLPTMGNATVPMQPPRRGSRSLLSCLFGRGYPAESVLRPAGQGQMQFRPPMMQSSYDWFFNPLAPWPQQQQQNWSFPQQQAPCYNYNSYNNFPQNQLPYDQYQYIYGQQYQLPYDHHQHNHPNPLGPLVYINSGNNCSGADQGCRIQ